MRFVRCAAAATLILSAAACVALNGEPGQKSPTAIKLDGLNARLANKGGRGRGQNQVNLFTDLQELQARERELRGEMERMSFELQQLRSQQKNLYVDLDSRIHAIERTGGGGRS